MSTILILAVALFAHEKIPFSPTLKSALYSTTIIASVFQATLSPPPSSNFIKYSNAFLSVAYALRALELLIVHDPSQLKRLEKVSSSPTIYAWAHMPPALSYQRLLYVCDLILNPRAIGWSHGSKRYLPRLERINKETKIQPPSPGREKQEKFILVKEESLLSFLGKEALKLLCAYLVFDAYQTAFIHHYPGICNGVQLLLSKSGVFITAETSEMLTRRFLLPPACWLTAYAFVDGIHAAAALFGVGVLRLFSPYVAGEPWMYPPVFGSWRYLFASKLREIWGKMWHDLCRRPLLTSSSSLLLFPIPNQTLKRLLVAFLSFALSGLVHAAGTFAVCANLHAGLMMIAFFVLLPLCIAVQEMVSGLALQRVLPPGAMSRVMIWVLDVVFVVSWGYVTSPWFFRYSMLPEALETIPFPRGVWERFI